MDEEKIKAIKEWPKLNLVRNVHLVHSLVSFYRRFVHDFSTIITLLTEVIKKNVGFKWRDAQEKAFNMLKDNLIFAPLLSLPNFYNTFKI